MRAMLVESTSLVEDDVSNMFLMAKHSKMYTSTKRPAEVSLSPEHGDSM